VKYTVEPQALKAGADRVARALETLGAVRIDEDLRPLYFAFAGGVTVAGLKAITNQWDAQLAGARAQLRVLGSALVEASDGYGSLESLTAQQLGAPGTGAP
jgi:hypothetical protein